MAFLERIGDCFVGHAMHCYRASNVYAFQIVGSAAKSPICREVPVLRDAEYNDMFGGSATFRLDAAWLDAHPVPATPLRRSTPDARAMRVRVEARTDDVGDPTDEQHVVMIVPNSRADYSGDRVKLPLMSERDARQYTHACSWCEY